MDYTKFPKQRGVLPSQMGARSARFIDTLDAPALRKQNPDGSLSWKNGGRLYVEPGSQKLEALYTSGRLLNGTSGVFRSDGPRGSFVGIGQLPFLADDGDIGYLTNNSDGSASVGNSELIGTYPDFDYTPAWGNHAGIATIDLYRTRNGRSAEIDLDIYSATALEGSGGRWAEFGIVNGKIIAVGDDFQTLRGAASVTLEQGHYWPTFYRKVNDGPIEIASTYGLENTLLTGIMLMTLGPSQVLMISRCARSTHRPTLARNASNPVLVAQYSVDGGATWGRVDNMSAMADELATIQAIPVMAPNNAPASEQDRNAQHFNRAATYISFSDAAPISATRALALMTIPYTDDPDNPILRARVKIVEIDTSGGCSITSKQTIFDGALNEAIAFRGMAWPTGEGLLYTTQQVVADDPNPNAYRSAPSHPSKIWHSLTGADLESIGTMPHPAYRTGFPIYVDRRLIACVMYAEGEYRLYLSTTRMATWTRGALITKTGVPPSIDPANPLSSLGLSNFAAVARLRTAQGDAAPLHPQAPWISDARYRAPE